MGMAYENELALAAGLARQAGDMARTCQAGGFDVEDKPDHSPVTTADKACERLMADAIRRRFPADGILGEEGSSETGASGRRWIIDPIDGTRDFVRGNRLWANFVALEAGGEVKVGACAFPELGELYYAARGAGAWREADGMKTRLQSSNAADIGQAVLCGNILAKLDAFPNPGRLLSFVSRFWSIRCLGGGWDVMHVAAGKMDVWLEPHAKPWDFAPLQVIAEEAGAKFFTFAGSRSIHEGSAVICAAGLENAVKDALGLGA